MAYTRSNVTTHALSLSTLNTECLWFRSFPYCWSRNGREFQLAQTVAASGPQESVQQSKNKQKCFWQQPSYSHQRFYFIFVCFHASDMLQHNSQNPCQHHMWQQFLSRLTLYHMETFSYRECCRNGFWWEWWHGFQPPFPEWRCCWHKGALVAREFVSTASSCLAFAECAEFSSTIKCG